MRAPAQLQHLPRRLPGVRSAATTPEGDIRKAFFTAYDEDKCTYLTPVEVDERLARGEQVVSATFVTPYPPGYPVLVPGQCFSREIMELMADLDTPEVHGYRPELGYRVFSDAALRPDEPVAERGKAKRRKGSADQPLTAAGDTPGGS